MQQSSVIFANLLVAYLLFITARGELSSYINLLRGGGNSSATSTNGTANNAVVSGANALLNNNSFDALVTQQSGTDNSTDFLSQLAP